jgi:hypothetical protein
MKKLLFYSIALFFFSSCEVLELDSLNSNSSINQKEKELILSSNIEDTDSVSYRILITGNADKTWRTDDFTLGGSDKLTFCRIDDLMTFNSNGTYIYDGGKNLCGAEDDERIKSGTWKVFYSSDEILFDEGTDDEYLAKIIGLNESEIRLKGSYFLSEVRGKYSNN